MGPAASGPAPRPGSCTSWPGTSQFSLILGSSSVQRWFSWTCRNRGSQPLGRLADPRLPGSHPQERQGLHLITQQSPR